MNSILYTVSPPVIKKKFVTPRVKKCKKKHKFHFLACPCCFCKKNPTNLPKSSNSTKKMSDVEEVLQDGQEFRESDFEEEIVQPPTQKDMVRATTSRKRQRIESSSDEDESPEVAIKKLTAGSFLSLLLTIWVDKEILKIIIPVLELAQTKATKVRNLIFRQKLYIMKTAMLQAIKSLSRVTNSTNVSFMDFNRHLRGEKFYTTFSKETLTEAEIDLFVSAWEEYTVGPSSLPQNTITTGTSSMTAVTPVVPVAAPEFKKSEMSLFDTTGGLFQQDTSRQSTGAISQTICRRIQDELITFTSPGEIGQTVIRIETYPFKDVSRIEKKNWWKFAHTRTTFVTSGAADPMEQIPWNNR